MLAPATPVITRSDYEAMPSGPPYFQLIEGELIMSPSPSTRHQRIVGRVFAALNHHILERELGDLFLAPLNVFLTETNVHQPDLVFVPKAKAHQITEAGIEGAPDLCIEVLSQSTARYDRVVKRKIFAQAGVIEYWLIDPEEKTVAVYNLRAPSETPAKLLTAKDGLRSPLFPEFEIKVAEIFG